jgi:hypothetical protein
MLRWPLTYDCAHFIVSIVTIQIPPFNAVLKSCHPTFYSLHTPPILPKTFSGHLFWIEFQCEGDSFVRPISLFEFVRCFNLHNDLTYKMSHPSNTSYLDASIPAFTSAHILQTCNLRLTSIRDANLQLFEPSSVVAPAAMANVFVNGTVSSRMPTHSTWVKAYENDPKSCLLRVLISNPSRITHKSLQTIHLSLRMPLRESLLVLENDMIILREPIGDGSSSFCRLQYVPASLRDVIFIAFHANPIGGHLNRVRTFRNIRLRYFWPGMFGYVKNLCAKCPGCALANRTHSPSKSLLYNFPITSPMRVIHADGYEAGTHCNFEGDSCYLVVCCGMTTFAVVEPFRSKDAKGFPAALMRIILCFGMCHTLVLDKASAFLNVFKEVVELLQINSHTILAENHNAMLVERLNRYLNKGLKIMTNERDSVCVAGEAILLLIYAWNSASIPGTDIPRSLVVTGRVFQFPIDFSTAKHFELTSSPESVISYAKNQATIMDFSADIARVLVDEARAGIETRSMNPALIRASTMLATSFLPVVQPDPTLAVVMLVS